MSYNKARLGLSRCFYTHHALTCHKKAICQKWAPYGKLRILNKYYGQNAWKVIKEIEMNCPGAGYENINLNLKKAMKNKFHRWLSVVRQNIPLKYATSILFYRAIFYGCAIVVIHVSLTQLQIHHLGFKRGRIWINPRKL